MEPYYGTEKQIGFSIDNLTIVGTLVMPEFYNIFLSYTGACDTTHFTNDSRLMFETSFKNPDLGFIQIDRETLKVRIEFNPNKITLKGKNDLNKALLLLDKDSIHFTRLDLAIDLYNYKISDYNIIDIGSRKKAYFYSRNNRLETMYSGSNKSSKYIRIYNKAIEQKLEDLDWWRFEIQLRDVYIDKYLNELISFYDDIFIFKYSSIEKYSIETNAMVEYLLHDISRFNKLSKNACSKYKKIIRELEVETIDFLDDILSGTIGRVSDYLSYILTELSYQPF